MKHTIFISYSRLDFPVVVKLKDEIDNLLGKGKCWLDLSGIESDKQFVEVIVDAINNATIFLFMYSKNSEQSEWTRKEVMYANGKKKKIVFVKIDKTPLSDYFAFMFAGHDIIYLNNKEQKQKLMDNLASWCQFGKPIDEVKSDDGENSEGKVIHLLKVWIPIVLFVAFILSVVLYRASIIDQKTEPHSNYIDSISPILLDSL